MMTMLTDSLITLLDKSKNCPGQETSPKGPPFLRRTLAWPAAQTESVTQWLASWQVPEKFYFSDKNGTYEIAGLGSALTLSSLPWESAAAGLSDLWSRHPGAVVFGGAAFAEHPPETAEWKDFGLFRFTLPLVEVRRTGHTLEMAFNYPAPCSRTKNDLFRQANIPQFHQQVASETTYCQLKQALGNLDRCRVPCALTAPAAVEARAMFPDYNGWETMILKALESIRAGVIDKVVLSRKIVLTARDPWPVNQILMNLASMSEDSYVFLYQTGHGQAFFGRTPERLLKLDGRAICVDAIAGTRPRGKDASEDRSLESELLQSPKEMAEHRIVSRYIEDRMNRIARHQQTIFRESILKLKHLQHIFTRHQGELRNGHHVLDTLKCFHPTPAVNGHPTETARDLILQWESGERGWYAGPVGWMTGEAAEFAVGIRSALACGKHLHIFAGAGIVEGSQPATEWQETEDKMRTIRHAAEGGNPAPEASSCPLRGES
jgi:menaquinone-specific isochorismate synthase